VADDRANRVAPSYFTQPLQPRTVGSNVTIFAVDAIPVISKVGLEYAALSDQVLTSMVGAEARFSFPPPIEDI